MAPRAHSTPPSTRADYAQRYAGLGYSVFPLHWIVGQCCSCRDTECRSPGKHPLTPNGVKDATRDSDLIDSWWQRWPGANIGMAMGAASGVFAVDVDPRNGGNITLEDLQLKHGKLPDTIEALTGGGGNHYLFRFEADRALPGKLGAGIDVKGEGGYIVVEPSDHVSGVAYAWEASGDPIYGAVPAAAPGWIFTTTTAAKSAPATGGAVGLIPPQQFLELRAALNYLPADDRATWVNVGMALKSTSAPNAYGLWTEWSQGSDKYNAQAQAKAWAGFKPERVHVESIFEWATKNGWVNPASKMATQFSEAAQRAIEDANSTAVVEIVPEVKAEYRPFPSQTLRDLQAFIDSQNSITHPLISQQATLALAAAIASRVYVGEDGEPCHLYFGIVADTIDYCRYAGDVAKKILNEAGLRRMIRGTRLGSANAVYSTLVKSPCSVYVSDEWGHLIAFAKRQPSGAIDQALNLMTSLYTMPVLHIDNAAEAGFKATDDQLIIYQPALSVLAMMSADQIAPLMRKGEMGKGALSQMLSVFIEADELQERKADPVPTPEWLIDRINAVRRLPPGKRGGDRTLAEIYNELPGNRPAQVRVRCRFDMDAALSALDAIGSDIKSRPFVLAAKRIARRLSAVVAAWDNPHMPEITHDILAWSIHYVLTNVSAWLDRFQTMTSDDGKVSVMQQVLELIERSRAGGISMREIVQRCWAFRNLGTDKREELIGALLADEAAVKVPTNNGKGRKGHVLVAAKHAKKTASFVEESDDSLRNIYEMNGPNSLSLKDFSRNVET